jgi:hypothetical protein
VCECTPCTYESQLIANVTFLPLRAFPMHPARTNHSPHHSTLLESTNAHGAPCERTLNLLHFPIHFRFAHFHGATVRRVCYATLRYSCSCGCTCRFASSGTYHHAQRNGLIAIRKREKSRFRRAVEQCLIIANTPLPSPEIF